MEPGRPVHPPETRPLVSPQTLRCLQQMVQLAFDPCPTPGAHSALTLSATHEIHIYPIYCILLFIYRDSREDE